MSEAGPVSSRAISLTFGTSATQTKPWDDVRTFSWDELAIMLTRHCVGTKEGDCFTPATFPTGKRRKADAARIDILVLDSDSGASRDDIARALRSLGWAGLISSTHSHLASETLVKRGSYDAWLQKVGTSSDDPRAAERYLVEQKGLMPSVAKGATLADQDETYLTFHHNPCPKFRIALPLARPWIAGAYDSQKQATEVWEERYSLAARHLGIQHDRSCSDVSRLFYLPRRPADGAQAEVEVVEGAWVDIFCLDDPGPDPDKPSLHAAGSGRRGAKSPKGNGGTRRGPFDFERFDYADRETGKALDLRRWSAEAGRNFRIVAALKARSPGSFTGKVADGVRHHISCPNSDAHTNPVPDAATFVCDPVNSTSEGFVIHCRHDHCTGRDRLLLLRQMLERGWLTVADLLDPEFRNGVGSNSRGSRCLSIGSDAEIAERVARDLDGEFGPIIHDEGEFWKYCATHWAPLTQEEVWSTAVNYDGAAYPTARGEEAIVRLGKSRIESVLACLVQLLRRRDFFRAAPRGINCASGFIVFGAQGAPSVTAHHRDHRQRHVLEGRWPPAPDQVPAPLTQRLLNGCFHGDEDATTKVDLLAEIAGIAAAGMATRLKEPKAVVFVGRSAENGKSQVLAMVRSLLPRNAVSTISPAKFSDQTFLCHLAGKLLNAPDELAGSEAIASEIFKQVVTGDPLMARDVYKSGFEFEPMAQHVFATNSLPSFKGGVDRGVRRRLQVLVFNRVIPREERVERLGTRIGEEEMDCLLDWAVGGASRAIRDGRFSEPSSSAEALYDWIFSSDPVLAWLESDQVEYSRPGIPLEAKVSEAYGKFACWAVEEGYDKFKLPAVNVFSQRVLGAGKGVSKRRLSAGSRFLGLAAIGPAPEKGSFFVR